MVSPQTKQKVGIDIKIGNCQVLVYPSTVEQGQYRWLRAPGSGPLARIGDTPFTHVMQYHVKRIMGDAAAATAPTVGVMTAPTSEVSESDDSNAMPSDLRAKTLRTLSLLSRERVADYEGWRNVGFALGRIFYTEDMKAIFHKWSREWANYNSEDVDAHWAHCDPANRPRGYAMAALRRWAQEDNPELFRQLFPDTIPLLDENSKVYFGKLGGLKKKYDHKITPAEVGAVRREIEEFYRKTVGVIAAKGVLLKLEDEWGWHFEYTSLSEFMRHHTGDAIYYYDGDKELKIDFMDVFKRLKLSELTFSYIKFQPWTPLAPIPQNAAVLNLFTGLAVESATRLQLEAELEEGVTYDPELHRADWEPWLTQTKEVVCYKHPPSFEYLLNALAYILQRLARLNIAILLQGMQGTGKTEWVNFLLRIIGQKYYEVIQREQDTKSEFTGDRRMHIVRVYEDGKGRVLQRMCGEIKNEITADTVATRLLFKNREQVPNWATIFMTINDTCAFDYAEFQRRLLALGQNPKYSSEYPGHDPDYIAHNKKMADYYKSVKAQVAVYRLLMARDISAFDYTDVPLTPLMENWRGHNPAGVADFCINLGREYSHLLKDESKPNSRGPPTSLLHAV